MIIRAFELTDESAVIDLWQHCDLIRPQNDPTKDIRRKLNVQPGMFLIAKIENEIIGTVMAGYEGHRGWINYLAVSPAHRRQGIGAALMHEAEQLLKAEGCAKINLQVRSTNRDVIDFYRKIGFAVDDVVSMGKRLEHD
jgi:ribosomal protein S18 acetylase RimI-like enzyme